MALAAYLVKVAAKCGQTLKGGQNAKIVIANSETEAKQIAEAQEDGEGIGLWTDSTTTATELTTAADWEGWTFKIDILGGCGTGNNEPLSVSYTGTSTNDTIDEIGAALVTALNATSDISAASYTSNTLTIAGSADALGDQQVEVTITPPSGYSGVAALVGTITDGGSSSDALTVVLPADALVPPKVLYKVKA